MAYNKISWNPKYQVINNLDYEITQFLEKDSFKPDDLVILWVGANDYLAWLEHRAGCQASARRHQ